MDEVEQARAVIADLRDKLAAAERDLAAAQEERRSIALAAHAGDDEAAHKALTAANRKIANLTAERDSLAEAIVDAERQVATAEKHAAAAGEREKAEAAHPRLGSANTVP